jgi:uncharacterized GH25 family protein
MNRSVAVIVGASLLAIAAAATVADAHDLFLRPRDFIAAPDSDVQVRVLNGSFTSSEAMVAPERLRDLSVVGPAGLTHPDRATWRAGTTESGWTVRVGGPGTWLLGASLDPKTIRLVGAQFNAYLREEGLSSVVEERTAAHTLGAPAHERYAKHVKALLRVRTAPGRAAPSSDTAYRVVLGYPAELVPLDDPYVLPAGGTLRLRALVDGRPTRGQVVLAGGRSASGARLAQRQLRTDSAGVVRVRLDARGAWYVKFIAMRTIPASAKDSVTHESKWATLTFARP